MSTEKSPLSLILASGSPRRREFFTRMGWTFTVVKPGTEERVHPGETPEQYVRRNAEEKSADALAAALDRTAPQWIYLPDGTPVEWRKELLHALLVRQRIDPKTSGGFWSDPSDPAPTATLRATLLALRAISSSTHLPVPAP